MSLKDIIALSNYHLHSYSGRGMSGKRCLAISTCLPPQRVISDLLLISADGLDVELGQDAAQEWHQNHLLFISDVMTYDVDHIGNDLIIYWRSIPE